MDALCKSNELSSLHVSLNAERKKTLVEAATKNRFHSLRRDEKALVSCMTKELVEYNHYLHALKEAAFLHKFIVLVQDFTLRKLRGLYLNLSALIGTAYCNNLEDMLYHLKELYSNHEQLNGYLNTQAFRTWAVGSAHNPHHKHKPLFRYHFPACDFHQPLVIRNPCLWLENAARMLYTLVDIYTKFHCTRAYALSCSEFLWLGRQLHCNTATVKSTEYTDRLWLHCRTAFDCHDHCKCIRYNAIWFPQFHMYVQFTCVQTLCSQDLFIEWNKTINCCDEARQQALYGRCCSCCTSPDMDIPPPCVQIELFYRPSVDWDLFCPFKLDVTYKQRDCHTCDATDGHGLPGHHHHKSKRVCMQFKCVREDCLMVTESKPDVHAGTYLTTEFKESNVTPTHWKKAFDQLLEFYHCAIERVDMYLLQTETTRKQIQSVIDCIQSNIGMYKDLLGSIVSTSNAQTVNKIRKLNNIIHAVEKCLEQTPMKIVARSRKTGKSHVLESECKKHGHTKGRYPLVRSYSHPPIYGPDCSVKTSENCHPHDGSDCESVVSRFTAD